MKKYQIISTSEFYKKKLSSFSQLSSLIDFSFLHFSWLHIITTKASQGRLNMVFVSELGIPKGDKEVQASVSRVCWGQRDESTLTN